MAQATVPVGKPTINVIEANKLGMEARGAAIADLFIKEVKDQAGVLKRYLSDIVALDQFGRKAFRTTISHHLKDMRAYVKAREGKADHDQFKKSLASAQVRLSEAMTFSKAVDAGYLPNVLKESYHSIIAASRVFLASEAATGPTQRRGRKATPIVEKVRNYLFKLELDKKQLAEVAACVLDWAKHPEKLAEKPEKDEADQQVEGKAPAAATKKPMVQAPASVH